MNRIRKTRDQIKLVCSFLRNYIFFDFLLAFSDNWSDSTGYHERSTFFKAEETRIDVASSNLSTHFTKTSMVDWLIKVAFDFAVM